MISAAAADWQAAGSRGADCDPKDVARMVEDYVIEKKKKEDASSQQTLTSLLNIAQPAAFRSRDVSFYYLLCKKKPNKKNVLMHAWM